MKGKILLILIALVAVLVSFSLFTVSEKERAIKFQLGKIIRSDYAPGLYFKIPIFQDVRKFDARIQTLDAPAELYLTSEKKRMLAWILMSSGESRMWRNTTRRPAATPA